MSRRKLTELVVVPTSPLCVTVKNAGLFLGIGEDSVRRALDAGRLTPVRYPGLDVVCVDYQSMLKFHRAGIERGANS